MFCPKCATQNLDGASFCRSCGANISLVPQALSGQLPQAVPPDEIDARGRGWRKRGREASLERAFRSAFMGIAFLLVAIALSMSRMGTGWWFWMLIPAFSMMGTGVAQYIRVKDRERQQQQLQVGKPSQPSMQAPNSVDLFPAPRTGELVPPPPSVTEGTTRHLGAEVPTRQQLDVTGESSK